MSSCALTCWPRSGRARGLGISASSRRQFTGLSSVMRCLRFTDRMPRWDFRPHGTIVDEETFGRVTELETRQAARLQYAVSMLTIHRSEEHTSELQSHSDLVCRLLLEKKKTRAQGRPA